MRRLILAATTCGVALTLLAGCSTKGALKPNAPPDTRIFVQGPVDTVSHNIHLYWFGTDVDGAVSGFEIRLLDSVDGAGDDVAWVFTTETDSMFSIQTPEGYRAPVLEVRAVDAAGLRDPSPARQSFKFSNLPPTVTLVNRHRMADTTYGSVTLRWQASDPDGDGTKLRFFVWLDGNEGSKDLVAGNSHTVPTSRFLQGGILQTGPRQMFIQAIDDGGMLSAIDSTRWMVRSPGTGGRHPNMGRLLLIDDQPSNWGLNSQNFTADTLYYNTAARNLLPGQYSLLQMEYNDSLSTTGQPIFRSSADLLQTFRQFDAVVWYIGGVDVLWVNWNVRNTLAVYQDAVGAYLESGGNLYLEGLNLINTPLARGPLRSDFVTSYLGSDFLFQHETELNSSDSTASWGILKNGKFRTSQGDSLRCGNAVDGGVRCFGVRDDSYGIIWTAPPPAISLVWGASLPPSVPVAVSVPQPGGGRCAMVTFPLERLSSTASVYGVYQNSFRFLANVFQQFGLTTP